MNNAKLTREKSDGDAVDFKAKLEKYKEQLYNVKIIASTMQLLKRLILQQMEFRKRKMFLLNKKI